MCYLVSTCFDIFLFSLIADFFVSIVMGLHMLHDFIKFYVLLVLSFLLWSIWFMLVYVP